MPFKVVLDANVLYPFSLRDVLLRLAERELYVPFLSDRILEEMARNLVNNHPDAIRREKADGLVRSSRTPSRRRSSKLTRSPRSSRR